MLEGCFRSRNACSGGRIAERSKARLRRELRMTEEQRQKFFKPRHKRIERRHGASVATLVAWLMWKWNARSTPRRALSQKTFVSDASARARATAHRRGNGPRLDKQLAATAELLQLLGSDAMAAALYGDLHRRYARSKVEERRISRIACSRRRSPYCQTTKRSYDGRRATTRPTY